MRLRIIHANVFDPAAGEFVGERAIEIEGGLIVGVEERAGAGAVERTIDARGAFALPGFVDAHVHTTITTMNFARALSQSEVEWSLEMARLARDTVERGFTTVRDTGGDCAGLVQSIERGLCVGPRIIRAGRVLSQTGGHGDIRPREVPVPTCGCEIVTGRFGHIADGVDAVRKVARHELRAGSQFLKLMSSGGVASPMDPFDSIQYTAEETAAAVVEAEHRQTYVTSHAYSPEAIRLAVDSGVTCIEHGNMIDEATAAHLAQLGTTLVPTLVTYEAMASIGEKLGLPQRNVDKNKGVFEAGIAGLETARAAGVELGFGTDLLGESQFLQNREFAIRADVQPALEVLQSMWLTNPKLCGLEGEIGTLTPDARADVVLTGTNPLDDLGAFADPARVLSHVISDGEIVVEREL